MHTWAPNPKNYDLIQVKTKKKDCEELIWLCKQHLKSVFELKHMLQRSEKSKSLISEWNQHKTLELHPNNKKIEISTTSNA